VPDTAQLVERRRSSGWNITMTAMMMNDVAFLNSHERRIKLNWVAITPVTASRMRPTRICVPCVAAEKTQQLIKDEGDHRHVDHLDHAKVADDVAELREELLHYSPAPSSRLIKAICA